MRLVLSVWSRGELFAEDRLKALQAREGQPLDNTRDTEIRDGVAIIPIEGPLMRKASMLSAVSGATSYAELRKDFQRAIDDPSVNAILFDINSPGGEVDGCGELANAIFAARGKKRIVAYVGGIGASAAYWLASSADEIVCAETATLGSIGVRTSLFDDSVRDTKEGVKEVEIISSASPGKRGTPVDDEVIARAQVHVDQLADVFISTVARHRGVSPEQVVSDFGGGDVIVGAHAVEAKLADRLGNLEDVIVELSGTAKSEPTNPPQGAKMARQMNSATASIKAPHAEGAPNDPPGGKKKGAAEDMPSDGAEDEMESDADSAAECAKCDGTGKVDGEECKACHGSGKAEDESAADDDGAEDDDMPEKKKEEAAHKALAKKLGLPPTASRREVLLAAQTGAVPSASVEAMVDRRVAAQLAKVDQARAKKDAEARAHKLVSAAVRGGWEGDKEDRSALVELATMNYKAAERTLAGYLKSNSDLGRRITPSESDRAEGDSGIRVTKIGQLEIHRHGSSFAAAAKALASKEGIKYEAAMDRVKSEQPALWDAYMGGH